jgi:hypothetical protein
MYMLMLLFLCLTAQAQWKILDTLSSQQVNCITTDGAMVMAGTAWSVSWPQGGGVFVSTDNGLEWHLGDSIDTAPVSLASMGDVYFVGTSDGPGVLVSHDSGATWQQSGLRLGSAIHSMAIIGPKLIVSTLGSGIFCSSDTGNSWIQRNAGLSGRRMRVLHENEAALYGGESWDDLGGVFRSIDSGASWSAFGSNLIRAEVTGLAFVGASVFCSTEATYTGYRPYYYYPPYGIWRCDGADSTWRAVNDGLSNLNVHCLTGDGKNLFAGTVALPSYGYDSAGVFYSSNAGAEWRAVNEGLGAVNISSIAMNGAYLYVGLINGSVWRRPLSEIITAANEEPSSIPVAYALSQNYPNPFNPVTTIAYAIPVQSHTTLRVYTVHGQLVATLVDALEGPGYKSVAFDASRLPSGVYFCRLQAAGYTDVKKLLLMR